MLARNSAWLLHSGGIEGSWLFLFGSSLLPLVFSPPPWLDSPIEFQPPERAGSHRAEHSRVGVDVLALGSSQRCVFFIVFFMRLTTGALGGWKVGWKLYHIPDL